MILGLIFICFGIYYLLKLLIPGFDLELSWSIVLPAIIMLVGISNLIKFKKFDLFNIALAVFGLLYVLIGLNIIPKIDHRIIGAIFLIIVGIAIITSAVQAKKLKKIRVDNKVTDEEVTNYNGIFAGIEEKIVTDNYKGSNIYAVFGGVELDLRNAKIKEDIIINAYSVFGGVDLLLPEDVNIVIKSGCAFGGVENKTNNKHDDKHKTITVNATAVFGGVDLK